MDAEAKEEMQALVVGFLQQGLQEFPQGYTLAEFERLFPLKTEEPSNWYTRYGFKSTLEALKCIPETVSLYNKRISLNKRSSKVDSHLVDLITNQKQSSKKRSSGGRPSNRAFQSFKINQQYSLRSGSSNYRTSLFSSNYSSSTSNSHRSHQQDQYNRSSDYSRPPLQNRQPPQAAILNDPRQRHLSSATSLTPPQLIRSNLPPSSKPPIAPKPQTISLPPQQQQPTPQKVKPSPPVPIVPSPTLNVPISSKPTVPSVQQADPQSLIHKEFFRQRVVYLLNKKYGSIKLLHLNSLYEIEFEEKINFTALGHPNLKTLLLDPVIQPYLQINYTSPPTITIRKDQIQGKENNIPTPPPPAQTNGLAISNSYQNQFNTIDVFNTRTLNMSLDGINLLKEPQVKNGLVEDMVKYKTMRIIVKSKDHSLKLDDWPVLFSKETNGLRTMSIRDYGFKTLLEFFKCMAKELPIRIKLNKQDEWIATADLELLENWLNEQMNQQKYKAMVSLDSLYEIVSFPDDTFVYAKPAELIGTEFHPSHILNIKNVTNFFIQLRTAEKIKHNANVDASMTAYDDFKARDLLGVPDSFIRPGFPCAIRDNHQQMWCRALVLAAPNIVKRDSELVILLVDYGIERKCIKSELLCLLKTHLKMPVGPIYATLSNLNLEQDESLKRLAKQILHEYTNPPVTLACRFVSSKPSNDAPYLPKDCFEVELFDTRNEETCNLNEHIMRGGKRLNYLSAKEGSKD